MPDRSSQAAEFTKSALSLLNQGELIGALLWCYGDYAPALWKLPPLDQAVHERYFGMWRSNRSEKPAVQAVRDFKRTSSNTQVHTFDWIDIQRDEFYKSPRENLKRLYQRFQLVGGQSR